MTEQAKDIAYLALEIYRSRRDLAGCVNYCLSCKTNKKNGKKYWYIQRPTSEGRKQVKIEEGKEAAYIAAYAKKKELKTYLRRLMKEYHDLSFADRKAVRYLVSCYRESEAAGIGKIKKNTHSDGTSRDSKSELAISLILEKFHIPYEYGYPIYASGRPYVVDFYFPASRDYYEHMGMLDNEAYREHQKDKLANYAADGIKEEKNLLVTEEHQVEISGKKYSYLDTREIILKLTVFGQIPPHKAFKELFPGKKAKI